MSSDAGSNSRKDALEDHIARGRVDAADGLVEQVHAARRDMMRLIWSFSPMPLLISERRRSVGSAKKSTIEAALSASKSQKNVE